MSISIKPFLSSYGLEVTDEGDKIISFGNFVLMKVINTEDRTLNKIKQMAEYCQSSHFAHTPISLKDRNWIIKLIQEPTKIKEEIQFGKFKDEDYLVPWNRIYIRKIENDDLEFEMSDSNCLVRELFEKYLLTQKIDFDKGRNYGSIVKGKEKVIRLVTDLIAKKCLFPETLQLVKSDSFKKAIKEIPAEKQIAYSKILSRFEYERKNVSDSIDKIKQVIDPSIPLDKVKNLLIKNSFEIEYEKKISIDKNSSKFKHGDGYVTLDEDDYINLDGDDYVNLDEDDYVNLDGDDYVNLDGDDYVNLDEDIYDYIKM